MYFEDRKARALKPGALKPGQVSSPKACQVFLAGLFGLKKGKEKKKKRKRKNRKILVGLSRKSFPAQHPKVLPGVLTHTSARNP